MCILQDLLTRHRLMVAGYLSRNYDQASQDACLLVHTQHHGVTHPAQGQCCLPAAGSCTPKRNTFSDTLTVLLEHTAVFCVLYQSIEVVKLRHTEAVT